MNIIAKYNEDSYLTAEHDVIYFGGETLPITQEDIKRLEELGWFIEEEAWVFYT